MHRELPSGLVYVRTAGPFDHDNHPAGLRRDHRVADGVWARLVVHTGSLDFGFEDEPDQVLSVGEGTSVVIPPARRHHVDIRGPVTFELEFYREADRDPVGEGAESTGLESE